MIVIKRTDENGTIQEITADSNDAVAAALAQIFDVDVSKGSRRNRQIEQLNANIREEWRNKHIDPQEIFKHGNL